MWGVSTCVRVYVRQLNVRHLRDVWATQNGQTLYVYHLREVCVHSRKGHAKQGLEVLPLMLVGAGNVGHERRGILRALRLSDRKETPK